MFIFVFVTEVVIDINQTSKGLLETSVFVGGYKIFYEPLITQSVFWLKAPDFMRAWPYARPTCTRCQEAKGPADT